MILNTLANIPLTFLYLTGKIVIYITDRHFSAKGEKMLNIPHSGSVVPFIWDPQWTPPITVHSDSGIVPQTADQFKGGSGGCS